METIFNIIVATPFLILCGWMVVLVFRDIQNDKKLAKVSDEPRN